MAPRNPWAMPRRRRATILPQTSVGGAVAGMVLGMLPELGYSAVILASGLAVAFGSLCERLAIAFGQLNFI